LIAYGTTPLIIMQDSSHAQTAPTSIGMAADEPKGP